MAATKEQERKALEQIRKIVDGLGENSYIGMAFEGCFAIAEENIDNDFACSMKQRAESAEKKAIKYERIIADYKMRKKEDLSRMKQLEENISDLKRRESELTKELDDSRKCAVDIHNKFREQEDLLDEAKAEIIKLKAKLYDLMVGEVTA